MINTIRIAKKFVPSTTRKSLRNLRENLHHHYNNFLNQTIGKLAGGQEDAVALLHGSIPLTPDLVIRAYSYGIFPAAEEQASYWVDPQTRITIPIENFHIGTRLKGYIRKGMYEITFDKDFAGVLDGCSETKEGRETTWITPEVKAVYIELNRMGVAHSVEAWEDGQLVGGLMGVSIGSFFATESLFYRKAQASKIAFAHLCVALKQGGYRLHDMQMTSGVSEQFGSEALPRAVYKQRLADALIHTATFKQPENLEI